MNIVTWDDMLYLIADKVSLEINMLPTEVVKSYLQRAAAKTARKTGSLIHLHKIDFQCGLSTYPLELSDGYILDKILKLELACPDEWQGDFRHVDGQMEPRIHHRILDDGWLDLGFCPSCDEQEAATLRLAVYPGSKSCGVYEDWFERASEAIASRAMADIYISDGPLFNPTSANKEERNWRAECHSLRHIIRDGGNTRPHNRITKAKYTRGLR